MMSLGGTVSSTRLAPAVNILPGMNAGASTYAVPSPIKVIFGKYLTVLK